MPYNDSDIHSSLFTRTFNENVDDDDYVWHRDHNNRTITVIEGTNWKLQYDNRLPILLEIGESYYIPKDEYHRVIKGDNNLVIKIAET